MTRPKVPPEQRQRTAQACESCKRRKQKCNGLCPCNTCDKRKFTCIYSDRDGDALSPSTSERPPKRQAVDGKQGSPSVNDSSPVNTPTNGNQQSPLGSTAIPRSDFGPQETRSTPSSTAKREDNVFKAPEERPSAEAGASSLHQLATGQATEEAPPLASRGSTVHSGQDEEAVVYSQTRMLQDPTGRLLYVGDSATLSFLQLLRMMVENAAGQSPFTNDPRRHKIVEGQFSLPAGARHTHLLPDQSTARVLVDAYFINTHGLLQVFERHQFLERLESCYSDPLSIEPPWLCILNLVFAIGLIMATPLSGSSEALIIDKLRSEHLDRAEVFYLNAKNLNDPMTGFEDQDFWSVQALLLMSVYMLAKSKRNTAFALLGMATRSAQALGLHREETLVIFGTEEQKARKNLWRSLFVVDRLLSCLLGRPTAISEDDCSGDTLRPAEVAPEAASTTANFQETGAYALEAAVRSCSAIGMILKQVYQKRKINTRLAQEIADVCKTWPRALPNVLHWRQAATATAGQGVAILHVNLFYCHSIILLTRPFFLYILNMETQRQVNQASTGDRAPRPYLRMEKFSEACVIASTHTILLVQNAFDAGYLSRRNPAVVYFLFAAALVILANEFAGLYRVDSPDSCIANSIAIMSYCAESDPQASRLVYILSSFRDVVAQQRIRRKQNQNDNLSLPSISAQLYGVPANNQQTTPGFGQDGSGARLHQVPIHIYPGMQTLPHSDPSGGFQQQQSSAPNLSVHLTPINDPGATASGVDPYSLDGPSKPPSLSNVLDLSGLDTTRVPSLYSEENDADEQIDFDALWAWPNNTPAAGTPRTSVDGCVNGASSTQGADNGSVPLFGLAHDG